jgi:SHS2 domain-containing protein
MSAARWEHFPHDADIGIRGYGDCAAEAFAQAALALSAVITDPATIAPQTAVDITVNAPDQELLLVDWLNALVYEMAVHHRLFSRFDVAIEGTALQARAWGEAVDPARHQPAVEVKGATYTELRVARLADGTWLAQCVVDV